MRLSAPRKELGTLLLIIKEDSGFFTGSAKDEFIGLINALTIKTTYIHSVTLRQIHPKHLLGKGQVEAIKALVTKYNIQQMVTSLDINARHERGLRQVLNINVFDRTAVILDIFARRARTYEGKLQVEMAQLEYASSRLVRGWTHLERQRSGIGMRGGPGEKQLELDRRMLRAQAKRLGKRLAKIKFQHKLSRSARKKAGLPTISLVGYTNAGKSSLFNLLTSSAAYESSKLFATLDPTIRKLKGPSDKSFLLADTVGFIESLSKDLLQSFSATFGEINESDLLLHVVDITDDKLEEKKRAVYSLLEKLGAHEIPTILVYNKIDMTREDFPTILYDDNNKANTIWVSAHKAYNINVLIEHIHLALQSRPNEDMKEPEHWENDMIDFNALQKTATN